MWAIVKNNQLVEITQGNKPITVGDVTHPKNIFRIWSKSDLKNIGVYEFIPASRIDNRFAIPTNSSYSIDNDAGTVTETINSIDKNINDVNEVDTNGDPILDLEGNQIITKGLKTQYKDQIKQQAADLLKPTDWMVMRYVEDNTKNIPSNVSTFRASVRTKADDICTAIDNCDTLAKLKALFVTTYNDDGSVDTLATMQTLPDDKSMEDYKR
tara:strand:- start:53 stop:688 length:636 start_codon:yes stop_codon:yes gene_type:complete